MKKNTTYILIGLAVLGGAFYYMKKKKKGIVTVSEPENITQEQFEEKKQPSPIKSLIKAVKKVTKQVKKPAQPAPQQMKTGFDPLYFQGDIKNKDILKNYKPVKAQPYNFPFLRPRAIKGTLPDFY